jgi:hypothetical protein
MKRTAVVWTASIVVVALGLGGRAGAQNIETLPPDAPPPWPSPAPSPDAAPEVTPATPPEGAPAAPPDGSPPAEAPATGPLEAPAKAPMAAPAAAAAFGEAWHYAISLERAVGYDHVSRTQGSYGSTSGTVNATSTTASNFSLFGVPNTGALAAFSFPRVAFDLFVPSHFSVGIGLGALYGSSSVTESVGDTTTLIGLLAAPRVGYALNLATDITLWARGGISVVYSKVETGDRSGRQPTSSRLVAATIELPIVFTVLPRLALTAGPTLDITFNGRGGSPDLRYDQHVTELGIQGGVLIHL